MFGKELPHLAVELRREGLVGRHDQRGALSRGDYVGDGEGLAASGNSKQNLVRIAGSEPAEQLRDRLGLVAFRLQLSHQLEFTRHRANLTPLEKGDSPL